METDAFIIYLVSIPFHFPNFSFSLFNLIAEAPYLI